jgi:hypothetical protein
MTAFGSFAKVLALAGVLMFAPGIAVSHADVT